MGTPGDGGEAPGDEGARPAKRARGEELAGLDAVSCAAGEAEDSVAHLAGRTARVRGEPRDAAAAVAAAVHGDLDLDLVSPSEHTALLAMQLHPVGPYCKTFR